MILAAAVLAALALQASAKDDQGLMDHQMMAEAAAQQGATIRDASG
jgi:hypothetical protein